MSVSSELRKVLAWLALLAGAAMAAAQAPMLCTEGRGAFYATLHGGIEVSIGAVHTGGFAARQCQAHLVAAKERIEVAANADEVDADALGVDLGLGSPVAAFQIHSAASDAARSYALYSLKAPVHLLRTLTGGATYAAADTDLDGRVEIWSTDAEAFDGLDGLHLSAFDFAPPLALRFENQQLIDVSAEFLPDYDRRIASLRAAIDPLGLKLFLASDGLLDRIRADQLAHLEVLAQTKIKALEIVACYLWSGREEQAARALDELWPAADRQRILAALSKARSHGMRAQVDLISAGPTGPHRHAAVYQPSFAHDSNALPPAYMGRGRAGVAMVEGNVHAAVYDADVDPISIQMSIPVNPEQLATQTMPENVPMRLLVDAAGKVREAHSEAGAHPELEAAAVNWKFIPAQKDGRPVAAWTLLTVSSAR